jgi:flagellum-specific peptidoglycan hydrolase FlgJ
MYSTFICLSICLISFGALKVSAFAIKELTEVVLEKTKAVEEVNLENARLISLQTKSSPSDVIQIAKIIQEILNTAHGDGREFLEKVLPDAIRFQVRRNVPVSGMVAMAIFESRYGSSALAIKCNNFYGIKASSEYGGQFREMPTKDSGVPVIAKFRYYKTPAEGFEGFYEFLSTSGNGERYKSAFSAKTGTNFVKILLHRGYCPDLDYLDNIKVIIARHHLDRLENILAAANSDKDDLRPFQKEK